MKQDSNSGVIFSVIWIEYVMWRLERSRSLNIRLKNEDRRGEAIGQHRVQIDTQTRNQSSIHFPPYVISSSLPLLPTLASTSTLLLLLLLLLFLLLLFSFSLPLLWRRGTSTTPATLNEMWRMVNWTGEISYNRHFVFRVLWEREKERKREIEKERKREREKERKREREREREREKERKRERDRERIRHTQNTSYYSSFWFIRWRREAGAKMRFKSDKKWIMFTTKNHRQQP